MNIICNYIMNFEETDLNNSNLHNRVTLTQQCCINGMLISYPETCHAIKVAYLNMISCIYFLVYTWEVKPAHAQRQRVAAILLVCRNNMLCVQSSAEALPGVSLCVCVCVCVCENKLPETEDTQGTGIRNSVVSLVPRQLSSLTPHRGPSARAGLHPGTGTLASADRTQYAAPGQPPTCSPLRTAYETKTTLLQRTTHNGHILNIKKGSGVHVGVGRSLDSVLRKHVLISFFILYHCTASLQGQTTSLRKLRN